jgi:single-strand DNA-binding protein
MANLNRVLLIGNLTRDPDTRYTPKGVAVTDVGIAVNRSWKDESGEKKEEVTFVDVTAFGRPAEVMQEYLKKGAPVFIEGRLHLDTWQDRQTNEKRSRVRVVAEHLQMLGSRSDSGSSPAGNQPPQRQAAPPARATALAGKSRPAHDPDLDAEPDDVPF